MKITKVDNVHASTTAECVKILNAYKPGSKWKRKSKFNISKGDKRVVRVFSDGTEDVTLIDNYYYTLLCQGLDLNKFKPLIDKISDLAKFYYTYDYGAVWLNPETLTVWVCSGDGGIFYSEKPKKEIEKLFEEEDEECFGDNEVPDFHEKITELKNTVFEAEANPEEYYNENGDEDDEYVNEGDRNYILICNINEL